MSIFIGIKDFFTGPQSRQSSVITLIVVNLFPIYGVFFMGWEVFPIMFLFWFENLIIGFYNVMRMLISSPSGGIAWVAKIIMVPFFLMHYGIFTLVHGMFVIGLFGKEYMGSSNDLNPEVFLSVVKVFHMFPIIVALFISHGYSYVVNFIGKGEYRKISPGALMMRPYSRVVLLHITLIFGAFIMIIFGAPVFGLLLFIFLKIVVDLLAHVKEHADIMRA